MVVGAFKNKCSPRGGKGLEWGIYHGLKWCLSLTKVLIIQSEEALPAHYLPENNNADTRLPGLCRCSLSEAVSCSTIHSISTSGELQDSFAVLHHLSPPFSLFLPPLPRITSPRSAGCPPQPPPLPPSLPPRPSPRRSLPSILQACTAPPLHPSGS